MNHMCMFSLLYLTFCPLKVLRYEEDSDLYNDAGEKSWLGSWWWWLWCGLHYNPPSYSLSDSSVSGN